MQGYIEPFLKQVGPVVCIEDALKRFCEYAENQPRQSKTDDIVHDFIDYLQNRARSDIKDIKVDDDIFALLCEDSSEAEGWIRSTKVCNVSRGCVMLVSTQQRNPDGSYALAEALTYVPGVHIDTENEPRRLKPTS